MEMIRQVVKCGKCGSLLSAMLSGIQGETLAVRCPNCKEYAGMLSDDGITIKDVDDMKKIKIKYLRDIEPLAKISIGDWIDMRCGEETELKKGEYKMIPLGVAMQLPKGFEAIVLPRSSTFKNYKVILVNSMGVIDETYNGDNDEWKFLAYALEDTVIPKNERICQFRIIEHQPEIEFEEVDVLGNANRGGIGSTGVQ